MTDTPDFQTLRLTRQGRRLTIAFNRPDVLNAVNTALHVDLIDAFRFAATDAGSDLILLTGEGRAFSAGGDLDESFALRAAGFAREHPLAVLGVAGLAAVAGPRRMIRWAGVLLPMLMRLRR